jgi:hypothetical protein
LKLVHFVSPVGTALGGRMLYNEPYDPYANIRRREQRERVRDDIGGPPMQREAEPITLWWYIVAINFILKVAHSFAQMSDPGTAFLILAAGDGRR